MNKILKLGVVLLTVLAVESAIAKEVVVIVEGSVVEQANEQPIEGASVSATIDVSPVLTDRQGRFKFIFLASEPVQIKIHKEGYRKFEKVITPQPKVSLDIKLARVEARPTIIFSSFRRGSGIRGRVEGLAPTEVSNYKVLVYVLTDKWYIHPYAENRAGRGFASIAADGSWRIETVWRGFQAYRVAFLLVRTESFPRPTVRVESSDPNESLLSAVNTVTSLIIDAPEGI
ncbi:MAG: carboxypeptidase-like regulatory domain-containing protein [Candidatus Methylomirabilales bacterium]